MCSGINEILGYWTPQINKMLSKRLNRDPDTPREQALLPSERGHPARMSEANNF